MADTVRRSASYLLTVTVAVGVWWAVAAVGRLPEYVLPAPDVVGRTLLASLGALYPHMRVTLREILTGFGLTVFISIPLALLIAYWTPFERTVYPLIVILQLIPKIALAPLFVVWFGFGFVPKVAIVVLLSFFPLVIDSTVGFKSVNPLLLHLARTMTASEWRIFWRIRLPAALPHIFAGLKVAIAFATVGAIVGEFVGADRGLGYMLLRANGDLNTPLLFAILIVLSGMGMALFMIVEGLERAVIPWHVSIRREVAQVERSTL
ncbi:MAG: ABC transporter permease [Armatimonadota bacterium]|nr:ABC transporter permease [Armatimonadota bacterium]